MRSLEKFREATKASAASVFSQRLNAPTYFTGSANQDFIHELPSLACAAIQDQNPASPTFGMMKSILGVTPLGLHPL